MNLLALPEWIIWPLAHLAMLLAFGAGVLLALGFFSARRGWEPRCRRCAHDLRSIGPATASCPECGADLSRAEAVITGGRRVRPLLAALGGVVLVLAIAAAVWLDERGTQRLRLWLAMQTPVADLVESVFLQDPDWPRAADALAGLLGEPNSLSPQGGPRLLASGELLDGVVEAARRGEASGRAPISAVLARIQFPLPSLDDAELAQLVDLAVDELVASEGARSTLYRMAEVAGSAGRMADVRAEVTARLQQTEAGRRALALRPVGDGPTESGRVARFRLASALDPISPDPFGWMDGREVSVLVLEEAVLEPLAGGAARGLSVARGDLRFDDGAAPHANLLLDAPPGAYRLRLRGVLAPPELLPSTARSSPERRGAAPEITPDAARALEGAVEYEGSCEVTLVEPALPKRRAFTAKDEAIAHAATAFAQCAIRVESGIKTLDARAIGKAATQEASIAMIATVMQDGESEFVAEFSATAAGAFSRSGGSIPDWVDGTRPFEIVLEPIGSRDDLSSGFSEDRWDGSARSVDPAVSEPAAIWARFILRYPKVTGLPEVIVERIALGDGAIASRDDETTRAAVEEWVAGLPAAPASMGMAQSFGMRAPWTAATRRAASRAVWPADLRLAGWFELWCGDRLVGETTAWSGVPSARASIPALKAVTNLDDGMPVVIRYRPDARVLRASTQQSADHLAVPFELVFPPEGGPVGLRWLDRAR